MPIKSSRIHVELGLGPVPLSFEMVAQAVQARMAEAEDLDWKQAFPPPGVEKKWWDAAKDVAAMANTGGGLIVYGVAEQRERADRLVGVTDGAQAQGMLQAWVTRWVKPLVDGLRIEVLDNPDGGPGLVVVAVPASPNAPHVVGEKNEMGFPYRYGAHTNWMTENEIERAYRDRSARRADDRGALTALIDDLAGELDLGNDVWMAVATRPRITLPPPRERVSDQATATIRAAREVAEKIFPEKHGRYSTLSELLQGEGPRVGLRRWTVRSIDWRDEGPFVWAAVELHQDGSIAVLVSLSTFDRTAQVHGAPDNALPVSVRHIDSVIAEAVALSTAHMRALVDASTVQVRATLLRPHDLQAHPLAAIANLSSDFRRSFHHPPESRLVKRPAAVEAEFATDDDVEYLRAAACQLADDIDTQFGINGSSIY
ncbi:helix-turn-helix domain-containing protein [Saccharothrix sp. HUAS TT1]|uniref:AlbA family DNA-binding domain-containing protein n=1 Tax=unclassified Saccharothrix TaxID=2593673 RepID=UPI00345B6515